MRRLFSIITITLFFIQIDVIAQYQRADSIENALKEIKEDSIRIYSVAELARIIYEQDTVKSEQYLAEAFTIASRLKHNRAFGIYYLNKGILRQIQSRNEEAYLILDTALIYLRKAEKENRYLQEVKNARIAIATAQAQQGDIIAPQGRQIEAIKLFLGALDVWKQSDEAERFIAIGIIYSKISTVYYQIGDFQKALEYDKLAWENNKIKGDEMGTAFALIYISDDFISLKNLDSALAYLKIGEPLVKKLNTHSLNIQYYSKLGAISRQKEEFKKAIGFYEIALEESRISNNVSQVMSTNKIIGICYSGMKDYKNAKKYFLLALPVARETNRVSHEIDILTEFVKVEEQLNNTGQAFTYLKRLTHLRDSMNAAKTKQQVAEIENKYQATEKQKKIGELEADTKIKSLSLKQKSTLNYILIGSLGAFLVFASLGVRNFRNRQMLSRQQDELQKQKISELEKDKQLVAVDSMLKGQEEERSRLAKDLHDGLGGMLSGVKFSLMNMKSNLIIDHENVVVFERSLDMLDTSISELRRVAHNMMPEALVKFGLDEALKDYCNNINQSNILNIKYQSFGMERLEKTTEIILYRVIQELLNNVFKHAKATEVLVQVLQEGKRVSITVEDNGIGLDPATLENTKGAGWANIRSRVDYLKGKLDVHSEQNKGTSINIEITV